MTIGEIERAMKVIESNPIIWGYKRGYSVDDIAEGLLIRRSAVIKEIAAYERRCVEHDVLLRQPLSQLADNPQRMAIWQRQKRGARAALAAIERERREAV